LDSCRRLIYRMNSEERRKRHDPITSFRCDPDVREKLDQVRKLRFGTLADYINEAIRRAPLGRLRESKARVVK